MNEVFLPGLKNKVAIVTGASDRLGRAMAVALAREGARVVIHYHAAADKAAETVGEIEKAGGMAVAFQADLHTPEEIPRLLEYVLAAYGGADILVNNAAMFEKGGILDTTRNSWDRQFSLNLRAPFFLSQAFISTGNGRKGRHIVNIAGVRGMRPDSRHIAYSLTKAGLIEMTHLLAQACAPEVQVNAIAPGAILPPPGAGEAHLQELVPSIPLRRSGRVDDIVHALLFLLSSPFLTGVVIPVTGGSHMRGFYA